MLLNEHSLTGREVKGTDHEFDESVAFARRLSVEPLMYNTRTQKECELRG